MGSKTSKRDSDGRITKCPDCGRAVRGQKGLKAHAAACPGPNAKKGRRHG